MDIVIGIILLLSFLVIGWYCIKGYNMFVGFVIVGSIWTILLMIAKFFITDPTFIAANPTIYDSTVVEILQDVFQLGNESQASILANIFYGAWFGRILMECGITKTLIRKTVELGGDKPLVTMMLLNIVVCIIFTSMNGAGPTIAIGVIVLPILLSLGVPKAIAVFSFMNAVGMGFLLNPIVYSGYSRLFPYEDGSFVAHADFLKWAIPSAAISLIIIFIISAITMKRSKTQGARAWAAESGGNLSDANAPAISLICPLLPFLGILILKLPVIFCYIVTSLFALIICGKLKGTFTESSKLVAKSFGDGVVEIAPLTGFLLAMGIFIKIAGYCAPFFQSVLGGVLPKSTIILCIIFAVLAPLGMLRGPFSLVGAGAATVALLSSCGYYNPGVLFVMMVATTCMMNISSCVTQSWVAWGIGFVKADSKDFLKLSIPGGWISCAIAVALAGVMYVAGVF